MSVVMESEKSSFVSSEDEYYSTYDLFYARNSIEQQLVWVQNELIPTVKRNFENQKDLETFRVLSVGPFAGGFDISLMEEMNRMKDSRFNPTKFSWTVIEPNKAALDKFKKKVEQNEIIKNSFEFSWINSTFEDYINGDGDAINCDDKFHFVHFVHCLYYMQEEMSIKNTLEKLLVPNGLILAFVGSEGNIWTMLIENFKNKIKALSSELHYPTNVSLSKLADENGWKYETFKNKQELEITEVFNPGDKNGIGILQFLLHTQENPYLVYGEELMSEVTEFLRSKSWSKRNGEKEKISVNDDEGIIIITK